jgi:serine phosphatase RsbU (regulator of sigma subunit)
MFVTLALAVVDVRANDHLLLITDGVTEANSPDDEWFGEEHVAELMAASSDDTLLSRLVARVREFENGLPPSDDVAALHLRYDVS